MFPLTYFSCAGKRKQFKGLSFRSEVVQGHYTNNKGYRMAKKRGILSAELIPFILLFH
jgi:hypothetical protein